MLITGSLAHCYLYYFFALFTLDFESLDDCVLGYHEELLTALGAFIPPHVDSFPKYSHSVTSPVLADTLFSPSRDLIEVGWV